MKHIVKYGSMLRESEERDEMADLTRLNRLGMIDDREFSLAAARLARDRSTDPQSLMGTVEPVIELEDVDGYAEEHIEITKKWLLEWRGDKGEKVVMAKGDVSEEDYSLEILISNGDEVSQSSVGRNWDPRNAELRVGAVTLNLDENVYHDFTDQYYDEHKDDPEVWSKTAMALLSMIVALGY